MSKQQINFYKYKKEMGVVEVFIENDFNSIKSKLDEFTIEDKSISKDSWQVLYMEQYFSADRAIKLCEAYDEPKNNPKGFYLVFFIYELSQGQTLLTPFGNTVVTKLQELPREYKKTLEFEKID